MYPHVPGMTIHRMMTLSGCLNIVVDMEKTPRVVVMTGSIEQVPFYFIGLCLWDFC